MFEVFEMFTKLVPGNIPYSGMNVHWQRGVTFKSVKFMHNKKSYGYIQLQVNQVQIINGN